MTLEKRREKIGRTDHYDVLASREEIRLGIERFSPLIQQQKLRNHGICLAPRVDKMKGKRTQIKQAGTRNKRCVIQASKLSGKWC